MTMDGDTKSRGIWAVVPVKRLDLAKSRLSPVLTAEERRHLSQAMLCDVLTALANVSGLAGILVVTRDRDASDLARSFGCDVLDDENDRGLCNAVSTAGRHLDARGSSGVICIPGDVPLVRAEEIDRLVRDHDAAPAVTLVPAWNGDGTNALLCTPARVIAPLYGKNSFAAHKSAAGRAGITPAVAHSQGLSLDLDEPRDLLTFLGLRPTNRTAQYLREIRIEDRLGAAPLRRERMFG